MHYVCKTGCQGCAGVPKVCETAGCVNEGKRLEGCDCVEPAHTEQIDRNSTAEE